MPVNENVVNWEEVKRRLASTERMLAEDFSPSEQMRSRILEERARLLACEPPDDVAEDARDMLEFSIGGERYAFEARWVREIVVLRELAPLPCTPAFVQGVVSVRGRIVSAVDLRRFWGLPECGIVDFHRIIVLRGCDMEFGVLADRVDGVASFRPSELLRDASAFPAGVAAQHILGVAGGKIALLDAEALLRDRRIIIDRESAA